MAALAAPMRQIIKEETTLILHTAAESVSASSSATSSVAGVGMAVREAVVKEAGVGLGVVREMAVKESPLAVGRAGGVVVEEGVAGGESFFNVFSSSFFLITPVIRETLRESRTLISLHFALFRLIRSELWATLLYNCHYRPHERRSTPRTPQ
jgi:hypothetical protein